MRSTFLSSLVLLCAVPMTAQMIEISPFAAYRWGGQIDQDQNALGLDIDVEHAGAYGVVGEIFIPQAVQGPTPVDFAFELSFGRQPTELFRDPGLFGRGEFLSDVDVTYYHAGISLNFPRRDFVPFFAVAAGFTSLEPDHPEMDDEIRFSGSIGGGAKVFVSDHIGFRFEVRGFMTALGEDEDDFCHDFDCDDEFDAMNQAEARLGLVFSF